MWSSQGKRSRLGSFGACVRESLSQDCVEEKAFWKGSSIAACFTERCETEVVPPISDCLETLATGHQRSDDNPTADLQRCVPPPILCIYGGCEGSAVSIKGGERRWLFDEGVGGLGCAPRTAAILKQNHVT